MPAHAPSVAAGANPCSARMSTVGLPSRRHPPQAEKPQPCARRAIAKSTEAKKALSAVPEASLGQLFMPSNPHAFPAMAP
jgi:hypothetical protein